MSKRTPCRKRYSVRFIGVSQTEAIQIKQAVKVKPKSSMPYKKLEGTIVLVFHLTEHLDPQVVGECIEKLSSVAVVDVFISIRTDLDSEIVEVPNFVTKFACEAHIGVTFSFTVA